MTGGRLHGCAVFERVELAGDDALGMRPCVTAVPRAAPHVGRSGAGGAMTVPVATAASMTAGIAGGRASCSRRCARNVAASRVCRSSPAAASPSTAPVASRSTGLTARLPPAGSLASRSLHWPMRNRSARHPGSGRLVEPFPARFRQSGNRQQTQAVSEGAPAERARQIVARGHKLDGGREESTQPPPHAVAEALARAAQLCRVQLRQVRAESR